jgi:hypothetical protein
MSGGSPSDVGTFSASSFGPGNTTFGPSEFRATSVLSSPRYKELDRRQSYFECTQHDHKEYDFDGRYISLPGPGALAGIPLLNRSVAPFYVPLRGRRPSAPYRLPRVIVNAFTALVFGAQRFPDLHVEGDEDTQDFDTQLVKSANLSAKMIRARNLGGSVGTVGLSWCYDRKGRPRVGVHNGKYLYVHEWDDREELIPAHVTEVYLTSRDEWDGTKGKFVRNWYWHRRDWNENEDILFFDELYRKGQEPNWRPDAENSVEHQDGFCHFSWIQNMPSDEIDGTPDYEGIYEKFDMMDILLSVITKGAVLNLDPTLVLKMDRDIVGTMGVKKGSDNSLIVGEEGAAEYLELTGQSLEAGVNLFNEMRRGALETAQAVILDPSEPTGPDVSSVAQRQKYSPMIAKAEIFREQYGGGMKRILEQMTEVARAKAGKKIIVFVKNDVGELVPTETVLYVALPPKVTKVPQVGEDGAPVTDEEGKPAHDVQQTERLPGPGGELELQWPPYFPPTPADQQAAVTAASTATGGKPVISQQTAVEQVANVFGVEPTEEWDRVQKMNSDDQAQASAQAAAFAGDGAGGKVGSEKEPPPGAPPSFGGSKPPFGGTPKPAPPGGTPKPDETAI